MESASLYRPRSLEWIAIGALVEFVMAGSLILGVVTVVLGTAQLVDVKGDRCRGFARSILMLASFFALTMFVNRRVGRLVPSSAVPLLLLVWSAFVLFMIRRDRRKPRGITGFEVTGRIGPLVLGMAALFGYVRYRGVFPWAMSGDVRNHVLIVRDTIEAGGLSVPGYPALGNAVAGLVGGWQFDLSAQSASLLGAEVAAIAVTMILFLWAMSLLAASLVTPTAHVRDSQVVVGVAALSLLPLSQFWLHTFLDEGFLSTALAVVIIFAAVLEVSRADGTRVWRVASCIMAMVALGFTYPPLVPIIAALLPLAILSPSVDGWRSVLSFRAVVVGCAVALGIGGAYVFGHRSLVAYVTKNMNLYGRITPVDGWALWLLTFVSVACLFSSDFRSRRLAAVSVSVGLAAIVIDRFLDRVLVEGYYVNKTRWMSTFVLLVLALSSVTSMLVGRAPVLRRVFAGAVLLAVVALSMRPVIQDFPSPLVIRSLATSWSLPTADQARLIIEANHRESRSVFWQVSPDSLSTRVIDIWITAGIEPTELNVKWAYGADVMSIDGVCSFAGANAPMTIWVPSAGAAEVFDEVCDLSGVSIEVIDW